MDGSERRRGERERTIVLLAVSLSAFLTPFMSSSLNLAIPAIGDDLGVPVVVLNWVVTVYLIASAALLVPFGRLGDLLGRRRLFLVGSLLQAVFTLACGLTGSAAALVSFRLLQGAAAAMGFATGMAILVDAYPPHERGRVIGISTAAVYVGLSLGPPVGGLITRELGWHAIFYLNAGLALAGAMAFALGVPGEAQAPLRRRLDATSALLYTASLSALVGGVAALRTVATAPLIAAAGLAGLAAFVLRQLRAATPLLDLRLFANPAFAFSNLAALASYSATFAVSFLLSLYLQVVRGLPPERAGLVLLAQPVLMAALSPLAGRLSDRVEPRHVASLGMALTAAALALLALLGPATPMVVVIGALALIGTGFALFSSPNSNAVMSSVGRDDYGVASAVLGTMRLVGQALSMAAVALITALVMGEARVGPAAAPLLLVTQRIAFGLFAALCAAGIAASLARGRVRR